MASDHRDRSVVLGAADAPVAMLAADETSLTVHRVAVGIPRRIAEDAHCARGLVVTQHPVVGDIAPDEITAGWKICGPLSPTAALIELLKARCGFDQGLEPFV